MESHETVVVVVVDDDDVVVDDLGVVGCCCCCTHPIHSIRIILLHRVVWKSTITIMNEYK